jgi:hypothetical protein
MATPAEAHVAANNRMATLNRLAVVSGISRPHIRGDILEVVLPQKRNTPIAIEVGYLIAQIVYPWPNWQAAQFDLRESYPAYLKYEAYLLTKHSLWRFIRRADRARLLANATQLRTTTIEHLRQFPVEIQLHEKQQYTLFMIPHDLDYAQYVLIGYLLAQSIYPHPIWQTKPIQIATRRTAQIVVTVEVADRR